jgi:dipeptidyl-peptidase-4
MKKSIILAGFCLISLLGWSQKEMTLEEAVRQQFGKFYPDHLSDLTWLPNTQEFVYQKNDTLFKGNAKGKISPWLTVAKIKSGGLDSLSHLPSLHWTDNAHAWFEENGQYYFWDNVALKVKLVQNQNMNLRMKSVAPPANWDFHAASGNIAFTVGNNLYVKNGANAPAIAVTTDAEGMVSGQSVSRNEYGISKGTFWSEDGKHLAYYVKDENNVAQYPLTNYNTVPATINNIRYPMAGAASELVSLWVYHLDANGKKSHVKLEITDINGEYNDQFYITNIAWTPDNQSILVAWLNRKTDYMRLMQFDANTGKMIKVVFEEHDTKWLEPDQAPLFVPGHPTEFIWRSYQTKSGFHNYQHYNLEGKKLGEWSTPYEQLSILGFSTKGDKIFIATTTANALHTSAIIGNMKDYSIQNVLTGEGLHDISISADGQFILDQYNSSNVPNAVVIRTNTGKVAHTLFTAVDKLKDYKTGITEVGSIIGHDGTSLNYRLIKPSNFDASKKYPVLVYVYNGPHVQLVNGGYLSGSSLWMNYFAEKGYLVFTIDGRGSANRGKQFEQAIHRQLGTPEMEDQLAGVEWLRKQKFVDDSRLAIHGWSFGGFMTTSLMMRQPGVFKCGVAGGPVLDWTLYEVMYTERYMDTPTENPDGYKNNNLNNYVKNLAGPLLMIHGTDDDVVVMQHNMRLLKSCISNNVPIDFFAYPGHAHNVRGKDRVHLMHKILDYVEHELNH